MGGGNGGSCSCWVIVNTANIHVRATSRFCKDYKLMQKRGLEMSCLDEVIAIFALGDVLDEKYSDHALGGD